MDEELEEQETQDSFKYLTPCLIDIATDFDNYVLNDTFPGNDDYGLEQILFMDVDSAKYYWLVTDWLDETEFIVTEECELFCKYGGWTGFQDNCLSEFKDNLWTIAWSR